MIKPHRWNALRLPLNLPIVFRGESGSFHGVCRNLSESGLLAVFAQAKELPGEGELRFMAGALCHAQRACVARVQGEEVGFAFSFQHAMERQAIRQLLAMARETSWASSGDAWEAALAANRTGTLPA